MVHSDLAGLMQTKSIQGSLYIATFIDDYSWHAAVYYLKSKDQFMITLRNFLSWTENQMSKRVCVLHSDCSGKYISHTVKEILNEKGIKHLLTMPGTP